MGIRTPDIQLAKLALYQLSYTPLLPVRRGIERKEKDQVVRCVPPCGRAEFLFKYHIRLGVNRLPVPQARPSLATLQGLDLSQ